LYGFFFGVFLLDIIKIDVTGISFTMGKMLPVLARPTAMTNYLRIILLLGVDIF
jgi:hypothetical protein